MNRRIMIVESHDGFRQLIGTFLSRAFEVVGAQNGLEAMRCLNEGFMPDVIVMDTRTPDLDGIQLLANLRCSGLFGDIPVIVMSGSAEAADEQQFKGLGASDYFRKPFNPVQLQERLNQIMAPDPFAHLTIN